MVFSFSAWNVSYNQFVYWITYKVFSLLLRDIQVCLLQKINYSSKNNTYFC